MDERWSLGLSKLRKWLVDPQQEDLLRSNDNTPQEDIGFGWTDKVAPLNDPTQEFMLRACPGVLGSLFDDVIHHGVNIDLFLQIINFRAPKMSDVNAMPEIDEPEAYANAVMALFKNAPNKEEICKKMLALRDLMVDVTDMGMIFRNPKTTPAELNEDKKALASKVMKLNTHYAPQDLKENTNPFALNVLIAEFARISQQRHPG